MTPPKQTFKNSNTPKPMKRPKGRLIKIDFGVHADEVKRIWETPLNYRSGSVKSKMSKIVRLIGYGNNLAGFCSQCKNLNTHILKQKVDGAIIITRFCEQHLPS